VFYNWTIAHHIRDAKWEEVLPKQSGLIAGRSTQHGSPVFIEPTSSTDNSDKGYHGSMLGREGG
jgi:hypothetical protein